VVAGCGGGGARPRPTCPATGSGADVVGELEDLLLDELEPDGCEVDGSLLGPDGAELSLYARDAEALARRIATVLADQRLRAGSHLVVRSGLPGSEGRRVALR
jgi:hypothetical protein